MPVTIFPMTDCFLLKIHPAAATLPVISNISFPNFFNSQKHIWEAGAAGIKPARTRESPVLKFIDELKVSFEVSENLVVGGESPRLGPSPEHVRKTCLGRDPLKQIGGLLFRER
jgi:hypothetical protein